MPSTLVHAGFALLLATGLLGCYLDRRALGVVLLVVVLPELDTVAGLVMQGAHRTLLHNLPLVALAAGLLLWETRRDASRLRARFGDRGVRIAWVGLFVHAFAGIGLDWAHLEGVNLLWPIHDQFLRLRGRAYVSTATGFVQTFVEVSRTAAGERVLEVGRVGPREQVHVANPVEPVEKPAAEPGPVERVFPVAVAGWQLYLLLLGPFAVVARRLQSPLERDR